MRRARSLKGQLRTSLGRSARGRQPAQAMVVAAFAITALLAFVALVLNFGMIVVERRHLQTTADASALAATLQVLDQQVPGRCQDSAVAADVTRTIKDNQPFQTPPQVQATYLDQSGTLLASVGSSTLPASAVGVQVVLSMQLETLLAGVFEHIDQLQVRAQSQAGLRSPDSLVGPLPIAVPQSLVPTHAACTGSAYNLYANTSVLLDLTSVRQAGVAAPAYVDPHTSMQYWSDGSHTSGTLAIGSIADPATIGDLSDVRTGLGDNATRQSRPVYIQARLPLCAESSPGTCARPIIVVGFTQVYILRTDIVQPTAAAYFMPYAARLTQ